MPKVKCAKCLKPLVPIGDQRKNGHNHPDWVQRSMHKKCFKETVEGWEIMNMIQIYQNRRKKDPDDVNDYVLMNDLEEFEREIAIKEMENAAIEQDEINAAIEQNEIVEEVDAIDPDLTENEEQILAEAEQKKYRCHCGCETNSPLVWRNHFLTNKHKNAKYPF